MHYTEEEINKIFDNICLRIINGESVTKILKDSDMPAKETFWRWLKDKERSNQYTRAKEIYAQTLFDECLEISDNTEDGEVITTKEDGTKETKVGDMIMHRRLRVDTRKWYLSKVLPKVYGDKLDLTTNGENFNAPAPVVNVYTGNAPTLVDSEDKIDV